MLMCIRLYAYGQSVYDFEQFQGEMNGERRQHPDRRRRRGHSDGRALVVAPRICRRHYLQRARAYPGAARCARLRRYSARYELRSRRVVRSAGTGVVATNPGDRARYRGRHDYRAWQSGYGSRRDEAWRDGFHRQAMAKRKSCRNRVDGCAVAPQSSRIRAAEKTNEVLRQQTAEPGEMIYASAATRNVMRIIERAAPTDANVLILGENGTGKELVARELHRRSTRADAVFLTVDMGSISETLFESELFGHRKGAFTGASDDRAGRFQAAQGGTLFLDEIGNLPMHLQSKLLRVLEERRVIAVGADSAEDVDVRIVAATNLPETQLRDAGRFRQDLLFRLNTVELVLPPLRERREDILPIARHYAGQYARKYSGVPRRFSAAAESALQRYDWPGNVRALRHAIERAIILTDAELLEPEHMQLDYVDATVASESPLLNLERVEKETIRKALEKHGFNISRTAGELGLTRASLYRRMEKYDF